MAIKTKKQFKEKIDATFEMMKTRDEAKACYDFSRERRPKRQPSSALTALRLRRRER